METVVGIFTTLPDAQAVVGRLGGIGIGDDSINILAPGDSRLLKGIPTTETEQPGMGAAMGGVVGGALGVAGGMSLGAAMATLLVPGVGPVVAIGLVGAALLGAGGAVGGAAAGTALEDSMAQGLPVDELFVYEDALRQGRSVVIAFADDDAQAQKARAIMHEAGAEAIDAARENWWIGVRDDEKSTYSQPGHNDQEAAYRRGFEIAQHPSFRGKSYNDAVDSLRKLQPEEYAGEPFRRGYERGQAYHHALRAKAVK